MAASWCPGTRELHQVPPAVRPERPVTVGHDGPVQAERDDDFESDDFADDENDLDDDDNSDDDDLDDDEGCGALADEGGRAPICPYCGVTTLPAHRSNVIDSHFVCDNESCDAYGEAM